jgi:hypothetical protein
MRRFSLGVRASASGMGSSFNRNRIAHKAIVKQIKPSVYRAKSGRLCSSQGIRVFDLIRHI